MSHVPIWLRFSFDELGQKEVVGGENPRIIEYHRATKLGAKEDEVPWCSAFVSWALERSGYLSTRSALAKSYLQWGHTMDNPELGCIIVLQRGETGGHVGFYIGEDEHGVFILGGNQGDKVSIAAYNKKNILGYRWPKTSKV